MKVPKSITLEETIWARIDAIRGDIPRSRFLAKLVLASMGSNSNV